MTLFFSDYRGRSKPAPADLYQRVATYGNDSLIVWSRRGNLHQVRYGLQAKTFGPSSNADVEAAEEFGLCVRHLAECDSLLD